MSIIHETSVSYDTVEIFGTCISKITHQEALTVALEWRRRGNIKPLCVAFPSLNPIFISVLEKPFAGLYENMDLVLPDGRNIARVARILGYKLPEQRIAGMDFLPAICTQLSKSNQTIASVAPDQLTADRFNAVLKSKYALTTDQIQMTWVAPYVHIFCEKDLAHLIASLNDLRPDIIIIGISSPKQEGIGKILRKTLNYGATILCVGGAMHTTAGIIKMAPAWIRNTGLESFYRFAKEPSRLFKRYIVYNSVFPFMLAKAVFKKRFLNRSFHE